MHTLALPVVGDLRELHAVVDQGAAAALLSKLGVEKSYQARLMEARAHVENRLTSALREVRLLHAQQLRMASRMAYPPTMRYLAPWALGIIRGPALRGGKGSDVPPDERIAIGFDIMQSGVHQVLRMAYAYVAPLHDMSTTWGEFDSDTGGVKLPAAVPLTMTALDPRGAYLIDTGRIFVLYLGANVDPKVLAEIFGTDPSKLPMD